MAVKYQCPKCGRRFAEWGAERLGFKCPVDELCPPIAAEQTIELVRMGSADERVVKRPSLKRRVKKAVEAPVEEELPIEDLDLPEVPELDDEEVEEPEEDLVLGAEPLVEAESDEEPEAAPAIVEGDFEEDVDEEDGEEIPADLEFGDEAGPVETDDFDPELR